MPLGIFCILSLGVPLNGYEIMRFTIKWFRRPGSIDHELFMKNGRSRTKPEAAKEAYSLEKWYPKKEYGEFKKQNMLLKINEGSEK